MVTLSINSASKLQEWIEREKNKINGTLCEIDVYLNNPNFSTNRVVELEYGSQETSQGLRPAAVGSEYRLSFYDRTIVRDRSYVYVDGKEYSYAFTGLGVRPLLGNILPIKNLQVLGKPREYEQIVSKLLKEKGMTAEKGMKMSIDSLSKSILSYISLIFEPPKDKMNSSGQCTIL